MTGCHKDVELLYKFVNQNENPPKQPLPNDTIIHVFIAGVSCLMLIALINMHKSL